MAFSALHTPALGAVWGPDRGLTTEGLRAIDFYQTAGTHGIRVRADAEVGRAPPALWRFLRPYNLKEESRCSFAADTASGPFPIQF
jgi:hypothetical protein